MCSSSSTEALKWSVSRTELSTDRSLSPSPVQRRKSSALLVYMKIPHKYSQKGKTAVLKCLHCIRRIKGWQCFSENQNLGAVPMLAALNCLNPELKKNLWSSTVKFVPSLLLILIYYFDESQQNFLSVYDIIASAFLKAWWHFGNSNSLLTWNQTNLTCLRPKKHENSS